MNYKKIYEDFIEDRRKKEFNLLMSGEYKETHHILPKSLNGSDEPNNLINLCADDHLFAHLLIAKIHGGTQWYSIYRMTRFPEQVVNKYGIKLKGRNRRFVYSFVRKMVSNEMSGINNPASVKIVYKFIHVTGKIITCTPIEFSQKTLIDRATVWDLINSEKLTCFNWTVSNKMSLQQLRRHLVQNKHNRYYKNKKKITIPGDPPKSYIEYNRKRMSKNRSEGVKNKNVITWVNLDTNEIIKLTQNEMLTKFGGKESGWSYAKKGTRTTKNWINIRFKDDHKISTKNKTYSFYNLNGESFTGTQTEISKNLDISISIVFKLISKQAGFTKDGWYFCKKTMLEFKENIKRKGQLLAQKSNKNRKKVINLDTLEIFESVREAARSLNKENNASLISAVCLGKRSNTMGYRWTYYVR